MKLYENPTAEIVSISADDIMNVSDENVSNVESGDPAVSIPGYWGAMLG